MRAIAFAVLLLAAPLLADESLTISTPIPTVQIVADQPVRYELASLLLESDPARVVIQVSGRRADGECAKDVKGACQVLTVGYDGDTAVTLINGLNTANLTNNSLRRRVLARLQADGYLPPGAIGGNAGLPTLTATVTLTPSSTATATATPPGTMTATTTASATP